MLRYVRFERYGLPFVSTNNFLVVTINGTGAVFESFYVLVFLTFAPKNEKLVIGGLLFLILLIFGGVVYFSLFVVPDNKRKTFCGCAAGACSIIMYLSPLFIMKSVIETKSVEYMPFFLSLFCFLCATSWFIYGLLGQDRFLYVPNGIGSALGAVQLILYFIYYDKKGSGNTLQIFKDGKSFNTQSSLIALV
ncbi:bidirectional sugar transporter SWEET1-like [Silene latifolia]|uniref:bidirectional sugar transporter SWEET1-like n=1 Tax=Silene latifolia TaxID=37657 RepID=UPI003D77455E